MSMFLLQASFSWGVVLLPLSLHLHCARIHSFALAEFCGKLYRLEHDVLKKHIDGRMEEERQKISIKAQSDTSRSGVYGED